MSRRSTFSFGETPSFFHGETFEVEVSRVEPSRSLSSSLGPSLSFFVAFCVDRAEAFRFGVFVGCTVIVSSSTLADSDRNVLCFLFDPAGALFRFLRGDR